MSKTVILLAFVSMAVTGCMATDPQRAIVGAAAGAVAADLTGNNVATGAALGAGAGLLIR